MEEQWKVFKVTEKSRYSARHVYEISSFGRCKKDGEIKEVTRWRGPYPTFHHYLIHRLVAEAFIPNPNNYKYVDHIDTDCSNNRVDNLRWCTQKQNLLNPLTREKYYKTMHSEEYHEKCKNFWIGYFQTEQGIEHRKKISDKKKEYWAKKKAEQNNK